MSLRPAVLAGLLLAFGAPSGAQQPPPAVAPGSIYFCPMHPEVQEAQPGYCPRCGMALVPGNPAAKSYDLKLETVPAALEAGKDVELRFRITDRDTGDTVREFEVVHGKRYHLFFVSQDLEHFEHIHPEQQPDGTWTIRVRPPKPGYYRVYSDFLARGGAPQVVARTFATAGFDGDLPASMARLQPDLTFDKRVGSTDVRLQLDPPMITAGHVQRLRYRLQAGGQPVQDLRPYLAAWGHTLVLSEDTLDYVHAHPIEYLAPDAVDPRGGPDITFDAMFPRPGRYRVWTQFQRGDEVSTVSFTVEAQAR